MPIVDDTISKMNSPKDTLGEAIMNSDFVTTTSFCYISPAPELIDVIREKDKITFVYKEENLTYYGTLACNTIRAFQPYPKIFKIVMTPAVKINGTQVTAYFKEECIEGKYIPASQTEETYEFP